MTVSLDQRELNIPLGIIVEKRFSSHAWGENGWRPVAVLMNPDSSAEWEVLKQDRTTVLYHAAILNLNLHRKDTSALCANLMLPEPELYVVMQESENGDDAFPFQPHVVTASAHDMQDWLDCGDEIVEKVSMPEALAALIQAFVEKHHVEEVFKKRKRDKLRIEDEKFGQTPIFETPVFKRQNRH